MNIANRRNSSMDKSLKLAFSVVAVTALVILLGSVLWPVQLEVGDAQRVSAVDGSVLTEAGNDASGAIGAPDTASTRDDAGEPAGAARDGVGRVYTMDMPADALGPQASLNDTSDRFQPEKTAKASPRDKMSGPVAALAAAGGPELVDIVVSYDEHPELFDDEVVASLGGEVMRAYQSFDMRAIRVPAGSLETLAVEENIDWLSLDSAVGSFSVASRDTANLPEDTSANSAFSGLDIGVAVIDTGISKHADLGDNFLQFSFLDGDYPVPVIVNGEIAEANDSARDDRFGHGTHVAGIITGSGIDSDGAFEGSAKGGVLLALQVLDHKGAGQMSDVMAALDWLYEYGAHFDVRVVNLSLGMSIAESNTTDPLVLAVEKLWDAGMVVVVAAGNEGFNGNMTITSPGNSRKVITVGSLTDNGTGADFSDDYVSSFSSRGPTVGDYVLKPDLVAPGNRLVAAVPNNAKLVTVLSDRAIECSIEGCTDRYLELSGTSMAAPMVTSAVARMLQKDPTLSPATVKARLMRSARKIDDEPTAAGAGVLDIDAALDDTGVVPGEALSPVMVRDETTSNIFIEDTAELWGDALWAAGYLFNGGFTWAEGSGYIGDSTVSANGYLWTDGEVWAKGYLWTDGEEVWAKGYLWTDGEGVNAKSLLDGTDETGFLLNDDS